MGLFGLEDSDVLHCEEHRLNYVAGDECPMCEKFVKDVIQIRSQRPPEEINDLVGMADLLVIHCAGNVYNQYQRVVEPILFRSVMDHTGNNQSKSAKILGLNRGTFRKKAKLYGVLK